MQINFHRLHRYIALLCGICLSVSVWYSRGFITYAIEQEYSYDIAGTFDSSNGSGTTELIDLWDVPDSDIQLANVDSLYVEYNCSIYLSTLSSNNISSQLDHNATGSCTFYFNFYDEQQSYIGQSLSMTGEKSGTYKESYNSFINMNSYTINIPEFSFSDVIVPPSGTRYMSLDYNKTVKQDGYMKFNIYSDGLNYTASVNGTTSSNRTVIDAVDEQTEWMKEQAQKEEDEANKTGKDLSDTLGNVTGVLSTVEILKLPWTMLQDLYNAIIADGETSLTFPSFSMMGYTIWDSYTFDLKTLDSQFSVLFESIRLVSGIMICVAFGNYIKLFFGRVFGNNQEVD